MGDGDGRKPLARCLGEAVGHLVSAVRRPVPTERHLVEHRSEVRDHRGLRLRRTVIDEVESTPPSSSEPERT
ncbi:MAG: hypothetical protein ACO3P9_09685 [Phycisphaerales bacterium]|jgi:hypothetical protein